MSFERTHLFGMINPQLAAACRVQRYDRNVVRHDVHLSIDDGGIEFVGALIARLVGPGDFKLAHIRAIDLAERRIVRRIRPSQISAPRGMGWLPSLRANRGDHNVEEYRPADCETGEAILSHIVELFSSATPKRQHMSEPSSFFEPVLRYPCFTMAAAKPV